MSEGIRTSELLSCPFCGEKPWLKKGRKYIHVQCACGVVSWGNAEANAVEAWNTRAARAAPPVPETVRDDMRLLCQIDDYIDEHYAITGSGLRVLEAADRVQAWLSAAAPQPVALDAPDGEGWWILEDGEIEGYFGPLRKTEGYARVKLEDDTLWVAFAGWLGWYNVRTVTGKWRKAPWQQGEGGERE